MTPISQAAMLAAAVVALAGPGPATAQPVAPGFNGYVTLATGYWSRGLSQNDDGLSLQLGVDYQHRSGLFVGAGLADVDYVVETPSSAPRELEMDAYLGYHRRHADWSWTLALGRYLYPRDARRYDYDEITASIGFRDRVFLTTSYTDDFFSLGRSARGSELAVFFPLAWNLELGAAVGRFDVDFSSNSEYTHWNVGLSKVTRRMVFDLRYYDSDYELVTPLGDPTGNQYVLSVSYAFRGRRPRI